MFNTGFPRFRKDFRIHYENEHAVKGIAHELLFYLPTDPARTIVFICIGTDRSTGDSLGPLIGSELINKQLPDNFHVFGTLEHPVHALNLVESLEYIKTTIQNPYVVAIDACLGQKSNIGVIQVKKGPLKPGAGVNKILPPVGDIQITGIVNMAGFMEFLVLQNTRLHLVMNIAKTISEGIYTAGLSYKQEHHALQKERKRTEFL